MYGTEPTTDNKGKVTGEGSHFGSANDDESTFSHSSPDTQKSLAPEDLKQPQPTTTDQAPIENASKVAGQGSHFPSSQKEENPTSTSRSPRAASDLPKSHYPENVTRNIPTSERKDQHMTSKLENPASENASVASIKSGVPGHQSGSNSEGTASTAKPVESEAPGHGASGAVGVGAGAAAIAAGKAWKPGTSDGDCFRTSRNPDFRHANVPQGSQPVETGAGAGMPGSFPDDDENPYRTAHIDPRVDSKPSSPAILPSKPETISTKAPTATATDRKALHEPPAKQGQDESHKGRDAGIGAAALGALGLGGYEAQKHHEGKDETPSTSKAPSQPTTTADSRTPPSSEDPQSNFVKPDTQGTPLATKDDQTAKPQKEDKDHHYGRDAGILGAAAAAVGLGSREAKNENDQQEPSTTVHKSEPLRDDTQNLTQPSKSRNVVDQPQVDMAGPSGLDQQRYDPSETSKQHITPIGTFDRSQEDSTPQASISTKPQPEKGEHHYSRDGGLAAGAGAAGLGTYETKKTHDQAAPKSNIPSDTRAPPDQMSLPSHNRDNSKSTLDDATTALLNRNAVSERPSTKPDPANDQKLSQVDDRGVSRAKASNYPEQNIRQDEPFTRQNDKDDDHTTRNAALGAAGVGAGAYGAQKYFDRSEPSQAGVDSQAPGSQADNWPLKADSAPYRTQAFVTHPTDVPQHKVDERTEPSKTDDHTSRNAALAGAAGVGAGAYAGHEYSQHEAEKLEKERLKQEKAHEKELAKEQAQHQKAHDKAVAKEAKNHEKQVAKEEKHAEKEAAKAEKKREKEITAQEKEQQKLEKIHEKEAHEAEKRHSRESGVVAGELPGDKQAPDSPSNKSVSSQGDEKKRHGLRRVLHKIAHPGEKDEEPVPDSPSSSHHEGRHKLHKDPPPDRYSGDYQTPSYADYAVKENHHQGAQTIQGGYTAPDVQADPTKYPPGQTEETSPLMDKEAHFLSSRFADHDKEDRVHQGNSNVHHG